MASPTISLFPKEQNVKFPKPTYLNKLGYVPIVGSVSGTCRIIYGVAKAVFSAIAAAGNLLIRSKHSFKKDFLDGLLHVGRGLVELVPFGGFFITQKYDEMRIANYYKISRANGHL